jgi:hypothetical protein
LVLRDKLSSASVEVATAAAAALWGLATTSDMRRVMADLGVVDALLANIKRTLKLNSVCVCGDEGAGVCSLPGCDVAGVCSSWGRYGVAQGHKHWLLTS